MCSSVLLHTSQWMYINESKIIVISFVWSEGVCKNFGSMSDVKGVYDYIYNGHLIYWILKCMLCNCSEDIILNVYRHENLLFTHPVPCYVLTEFFYQEYKQRLQKKSLSGRMFLLIYFALKIIIIMFINIWFQLCFIIHWGTNQLLLHSGK